MVSIIQQCNYIARDLAFDVLLEEFLKEVGQFLFARTVCLTRLIIKLPP